MDSTVTNLCLDKQCARKGERLRPDDFPRDRRRASGRYIYCRACCVRRERKRRAEKGAREYRRRELGIIDREPERISYGFAFSLVYESINRGARTREEIHQLTGVDYDMLGEVLVELMYAAKR